MPWQKRFFKGDEVWIRTDDEGNFDLESGRVPMKYERGESKVYHAHPDNVSQDGESAEEAWRRRLQEREEELDERERQLETRAQKLDEREEALDAWEEELVSGAIAGDQAAGASSARPESLESESSATEGTKQLFANITPSDLGPEGAVVHVSDSPPPEVTGASGPVDGIVEIHTDGACSGNPGPCGFGVVIREDADYRELGAYYGEGTNNIAELKAIEVALASLEDRDAPVRLYTDSRYCIGVLTQGWKAKANRELILNIRDIIETFDDLELRKVEGHAGQPLNERADDLAGEAVDAHM